MSHRVAPFFLMLLFLPITLFGSERIVAVQGNATLEVEPDQIAMEIVVENTHKNDVAKAKAIVDKISSKVAETLILAGVDAGDITSATITIDTDDRYDRNDNPVKIGHLASREIDVTIRDVTSYATIVQALVEVGVTRITGVRAEVSNYDELQLEVLGMAAKDARKKAEYLAGQLDAKLAKVHRIGDHRFYDHFGVLEEVIVTGSRKEDSAPYAFQPGPVQVNANINVEFELE
ncbi:MAG: hypothetical protein DRR42_21820 [Gammaproteobacteria bacterium]|nr:MAG: hypothetical protein DRR42_21820 [Gammaproteobacteria bacterium]